MTRQNDEVDNVSETEWLQRVEYEVSKHVALSRQKSDIGELGSKKIEVRALQAEWPKTARVKLCNLESISYTDAVKLLVD